MSGFRTEKQLWKWMKPRMKGKWRRVEAITPEGFPDIVGVYKKRLFFVELKVMSELRPKQRELLAELARSSAAVMVAYGSPNNKEVVFLDVEDGVFTTPSFWAA